MTVSTMSKPAAAGGRITRFSIVRIILGFLATVVPVALVLILAHQIPDKAMRAIWPQLLGAALCAGGYVLYVRRVEGREASELSGPGQWRELGMGAALGAGVFLAVIGVLAAVGSFRLTGIGGWTLLAKPFAEMVLVAFVEEILFRGVLFRLTERSLGSRVALVLSSVLFALAHLPNAGLTVLAVATTVVAGVLFAAAYLVTRRLWLAIGFHFAWNFISDGVFSLPTSGHPANGMLQGQLVGPDWLAGGAYGVEASAVTFVAMAVASAWLWRLAVRRGQLLASPRSGAR